MTKQVKYWVTWFDTKSNFVKALTSKILYLPVYLTHMFSRFIIISVYPPYALKNLRVGGSYK